ncbi:MAG: hypothetical protein ACXACX_20640 [Candidatus Hodarchaeales archaeon]|jgi:hypothetical protein
MGSVKNMVKGFIFTAIYVVITIVIPIVTFNLVYELIVQGIPLGFEQQDIQNMMFWAAAFGLVASGCAFFKYSSPKQSIRKGIFALIQLLVNCLYLWSFKFSGATEISFIIVGFGGFTLNIQQMVLIYLGIYFLTIVIKAYDIIDFTINREKIRENRMKA